MPPKKMPLSVDAKYRWIVAMLVGIAGIQMLGLLLAGRVWWCEVGDIWPWSWDVWSRHNSQHLIDPYSLSHLQHGLGLSLLLTFSVFAKLSIHLRAILVAVVESIWELVENTNWMIERYRAVTISLDYYGDSILNSLCDYGMCLVGIAICQWLPRWTSGALFVLLEITSIVWIHDSLLLNMFMLIWPVDAVREWQMRSAGYTESPHQILRLAMTRNL
jgi:hypothetical protein